MADDEKRKAMGGFVRPTPVDGNVMVKIADGGYRAAPQAIEKYGEELLKQLNSFPMSDDRAMTDFEGRLKLLEVSGGPIDVTDWYDSDLGLHFTYALRAKFADNPPDISFPIQWNFGDRREDGRGGPAPNDPVMLYVSLPLGGDDTKGNNVTFACSLEGVVDDLLDGAASPVSSKVEDGEQRDICARVAARLRELADKLDDACKPLTNPI